MLHMQRPFLGHQEEVPEASQNGTIVTGGHVLHAGCVSAFRPYSPSFPTIELTALFDFYLAPIRSPHTDYTIVEDIDDLHAAWFGCLRRLRRYRGNWLRIPAAYCQWQIDEEGDGRRAVPVRPQHLAVTRDDHRAMQERPINLRVHHRLPVRLLQR